MRRVLLLVICLVALVFPGFAAAATKHSSGHGDGPLGIVRPTVGPHSASTTLTFDPTNSDNLTYQGGPIMPTTKNYAIYWVPSGFTIPTNYKSVIDGYFTNVAAASGGSNNVYGAGSQYYDSTDFVQYSSTFGGSAIDTQSFPSNGCTNPSDVVNATKCLSDAQIQAEVARFASAQGWAAGPSTEFFVYTPANVGSCDGSDCAYDVYCAYHSAFTSSGNEYIYANMPYSLQPFKFGGVTYATDCAGSGQGHPNDVGQSATSPLSAADYVLNVTSHESNESITDPLGNAWWVDNGVSAYDGYEDGDLCAWYFPDSRNLGGSSSDGSVYNQSFNGAEYFLQGEWSNAVASFQPDSGCSWTYPALYPSNASAPYITGTAAAGQTLMGHAGSWSNSANRYWFIWQRCDSDGANCSTVQSSVTPNTTTTYAEVNADTGQTIRLKVRGANIAGPGTAAQTAALSIGTPAVTTQPSITGTATVGQTLTGHAGVWTNSPTTYDYAWLRCPTSATTNCTIITSDDGDASTTPAYQLVAADDKSHIALSVVAYNSVGGSAAVFTGTTNVVNGEPVYLSGVSITGATTGVGDTFTGDAGAWTNNPTSYDYTWLRCNQGGTGCSTITTDAGDVSTSPTYQLVAADNGGTIKLTVVANNASGASLPHTSAASGIVHGAPTPGGAPPGIGGATTVGELLTGSEGGWNNTPTSYDYTWLRCDSNGNNCSTIATDLGSSETYTLYQLVNADDKHTLRLTVSAYNAFGAGTGSITSPPTRIIDGEPVYSSGLAITGTTTVGQTLTGAAGSWSNSPTTYDYSWLRCDSSGSNCSTIATDDGDSSTGPTYQLVNADNGHTIKLTATAYNTVGSSASQTSSATGVILGLPVNTNAPAITGTMTVGQSITGSSGTWTNSPTTYDYTFLRCNSSGNSCSTITTDSGSSATGMAYQLVAADDKHTIEVTVVAYNSLGASDSQTSAHSAVVNGEPVNSAAPTIAGTAKVGQTLTGHAGSWTNTPTTYDYTWQRCDSGGTNCNTITTVSGSSSTTPTYLLVNADGGYTIRLAVIADNAAGSSTLQTSAATGVIAGPPGGTGVATITGTTTVGQTLTGHAGTWLPAATKYNYAWLRCDSGGANCATIATVSGSTSPSPTHLLVAADDRHTIKLTVTAINSLGSSAPETSAATSVVNGEPVYSSGFSLTGTATVGQVLTAHAGSWSLTPTKYTYTWTRCDSSGNSCTTTISTATSTLTTATYTLAAADDRHTVKVSVFALNAAGNGTAQTSAATSVVNGEPVYSSGFSLTGTTTVGQVLTAHAGTWSPTPTKYTYTWKRCDSSGNNCNTTITSSTTTSTTATYTLVAADDGHTVQLSVFGLNAAGSGAAQTSAATSVVNGEPVYSSGFSLSGTTTVGQVLTAHAGTWSPAATKYTYTWKRCDASGLNCNTIGSSTTSTATTATYKLVLADHGHTIRVTITALNAAGSSLLQTSDATAVVV